MATTDASISNIKILSDLLVNKIAAGEVIERPASVIKELVENALDAGASHISVTVEDGGKKLIRVADDGLGMTATDLRLAVTPHATSKISSEDDLFNISTLGFRGEALPSIGAVSRLRIVSRRRESDEGSEIVVAAERVESAVAAGCRVGSTVEVRDLFFNVPARRKFLRANATEVGHINEQISRMALAHRSVGFEVINNGRNTLRLTGDQNIRQRVGTLFSAELGEELLTIERSDRNLHIEGYVAPPSRSRSTPAGQYVLLNGRFIRDKFVQHAIREAYRGLMEHNRYPLVFLFLTIDPAMVDVNVHPTKIEVRWQNSNLIHSQVLSALRDKFLSTDLTPALRPTADRAGAGMGTRTGAGAGGFSRRHEGPEADEVRRQAVEFFRDLKPPTPGAGGGGIGGGSIGGSGMGGGGAGGSGTGEPFRTQREPHEIGQQAWDALYSPHDPNPRSTDTKPTDTEPLMPSPEAGAALPLVPGRALQIHNSYLVAQTDDGLVIIDQHALHERIMYEKLKAELIDGPLEGQRLLLPETLTATAKELALLQEHQPLLRQLGIEAEPFGQDSIAVHAFPSILKNLDAASFLRDLLDKLSVKGAQTHTEEVIHEVLDMMSCKAAVKAGDPLSPEEIEALLAQKNLVEKSSNCPHGRPTTLRLSINELEKQFKRR